MLTQSPVVLLAHPLRNQMKFVDIFVDSSDGYAALRPMRAFGCTQLVVSVV